MTSVANVVRIPADTAPGAARYGTVDRRELLRTKMYRPPLPADCVRRTELLHLLDDGRSRPLTLVSAPAGYGKSVLVSGWLDEQQRRSGADL